jgi:signal transduction histidine kinase
VEMRWLDGQNHEERFEPCIRIKTHWDAQGSLSVTIDDNGCGMTAETQQQMLVPFFTTKAPTQGTGIGLSITQQIITLEHSGELTCRSAIGQGTTFTIRLPV